jgi:hypothetical protein
MCGGKKPFDESQSVFMPSVKEKKCIAPVRRSVWILDGPTKRLYLLR